MKLLGRTLAILAAAMLIVGALIALTPSSSAGAFDRRFPANGAAVAGQTAQTALGGAPTAGNAPSGEFRGERERGHAASLFGAVTIAGDLVVIGVIVAVVRLATRALGRRRHSPPAWER